MKELIHPQDKHRMNWVEGYSEWGTVKCPKGIKAEVFCEKTRKKTVKILTKYKKR